MNLKEINFGVEIETVQRSREQVARAIHKVIGGTVEHLSYPSAYDPWQVVDPQGRKWQVVSDGSLSNTAPHLRAEVVTPVLGYADIEDLQEIVRSIRKC